jgi:hypothetical protein
MTLLASLLYLDGKINEGNLEASTACHVGTRIVDLSQAVCLKLIALPSYHMWSAQNLLP